MRLVLMGTGPFAVPAFEALRAAGYEIVNIITRPTPPVKSRNGPPENPVRRWAESHQLSVSDPDSINTAESIKLLQSFKAELFVVCDYGQILKPEALACAKLGGINLHGSLLPKYRGAAPVQRALLSGDPITGVSVIHMTPRLDGGPILATAETPITDEETSGELEERLSDLGVEPTLHAVSLLEAWDQQSVIGRNQDPSMVTKAPRLSKQEAQIDWNQSAAAINCFVRGMQPWPTAFCFFPLPKGKPPLRIAIKTVTHKLLGNATLTTASDHRSTDAVTNVPEAHTLDNLPPGSILDKERFFVQTASGVLEILTVQPAGKREMSGAEFLRGYQPAIGTQLT